MTRLYVPIGIPGCGKTTYGKQLDCKIFSSDSIRGELFGDEAIQYNDDFARKYAGKHHIELDNDDPDMYLRQVKAICNQVVFNLLTERVVQALDDGYDVYYDATNLNAKRRKKLLCDLNGHYDNAIAVYFKVPYEVCCERNKDRERVVPENVIKQMAGRLQPPTLEEGFSEIKTVYGWDSIHKKQSHL